MLTTAISRWVSIEMRCGGNFLIGFPLSRYLRISIPENLPHSGEARGEVAVMARKDIEVAEGTHSSHTFALISVVAKPDHSILDRIGPMTSCRRYSQGLNGFNRKLLRLRRIYSCAVLWAGG